jgi:tRNA(Ile)-lysidine synthetase-like protein
LYTNVLQNIPNHPIEIRNDTYSDKYSIYDVIYNFCYNSNQTKFVISLSGGVDSMVLLAIIHHLGFDTIAVHINYNNRTETVSEQQFIEHWCAFNNIPLYIHSITDILRSNNKRCDYEKLTNKIRFDFYRDVLTKESAENIILAHHKDDSIENIITNICRARSILNLVVIKPSSVIHNVTVIRPVLNVYKQSICDFAHEHNIPYFKDTTPSWSIRGILRTHIMPSLTLAFTHNIKNNLLKLDQQTFEWNQLIHSKIIDPFINECVFHEKDVVVPVHKYKAYPSCFWNTIFMKIFFKYKRNCPSMKSVTSFLSFINNKTTGNFVLSKQCLCNLNDSSFTISFN